MPSRLENEQSAYLRSAKDQPVEWYSWGPEPFERARSQNRPVLLDIGAVWCHWCHVMDHESYEDPEVAEILNREWVCIKVDRDERPDVDARYQRAIQALTGQGGWPLTAFLTPGGEVFYGGTYFPPVGMGGRPGFRDVLTSLARVFRDDAEQVAKQASEITRHLSGSAKKTSERGKLSSDILTAGAESMSRMFDSRNGGFGSQPKFPHPGACDFLLTRWFDTGEPGQLEIVHRTLDGMARGGVRDHLAGGFHRYTVDARWIVPHFEKMLYDNAELLRVYVHAASAMAVDVEGQERRVYLAVIDELLEWLISTMSDPKGGYYASQDADVEPGDDGDYFTWTPNEVRAVVSPDEFEVLSRHYEIDEAGEMHHNPQKNVLWVNHTVEQIAAALGRTEEETTELLSVGKQKLREARLARVPPFIDPTIYSAWNAMMASAVLEASAVLDRPALERHALDTLDRLFSEAAPSNLEEGVGRAIGSSVADILDDQVQVASAAVDAYEATGDTKWLERATKLMDLVWSSYRGDSGGLLDTRRERGGQGFLTQEITPIEDSPTPSPNGVAAIVLARLAELSGDASWTVRRDELLETFAGGVNRLSIFGATLLRAFDWALMPVTHVVVVGPDDDKTRALLRTARAVYRPRKVVQWLEPDAPTDRLPQALRSMLDGTTPRAYVCAGMQCAKPAATSGELSSTLARFNRQ